MRIFSSRENSLSFRHHRRLRVQRGGHNIIRSAGIPKPVVLVDTREQQPLRLFAGHRNWIAGERRVALKTATTRLKGWRACWRWSARVWRPGGLHCHKAARFLTCCSRCEAPLEGHFGGGFLRGHQARLGYGRNPIGCSSNAVAGCWMRLRPSSAFPFCSPRGIGNWPRSGRQLAFQTLYYWWLEQNGYGRMLIDTDGL